MISGQICFDRFLFNFNSRDIHLAARFNKNFLPYKINFKNYKKYSAYNTNISSCQKGFLIFTSNFSLNKNPFDQQKIIQ